MGDIVNLRRVRKAKEREAAAAAAAENRRRHGLSKTEREAAEKQRLAAERALDGAHLDRE